MRDFRDVIASMVRSGFTPMTDPVAFAIECRRSMEAAETAAASVPAPARVITIRYEDLVADPKGRLRELCDVASLTYTPEMVDFHVDAAEHAPKQDWMAGVISR